MPEFTIDGVVVLTADDSAISGVASDAERGLARTRGGSLVAPSSRGPLAAPGGERGGGGGLNVIGGLGGLGSAGGAVLAKLGLAAGIAGVAAGVVAAVGSRRGGKFASEALGIAGADASPELARLAVTRQLNDIRIARELGRNREADLFDSEQRRLEATLERNRDGPLESIVDGLARSTDRIEKAIREATNEILKSTGSYLEKITDNTTQQAADVRKRNRSKTPTTNAFRPGFGVGV